MHTIYKIETKNTNGRIVRVDDFTRFTEITPFDKVDIDLATKVCDDLNNSLTRVPICPTIK